MLQRPSRSTPFPYTTLFRSDRGVSQQNRAVAEPAPSSWATMNAGASAGRIPANVSVADRARVTAGFANDVEAVNQYAAVMYAATAKGTALERRRAHPDITARSPKVATNSLKTWAGPARACREAMKRGVSNITCAAATPPKAPATCATM